MTLSVPLKLGKQDYECIHGLTPFSSYAAKIAPVKPLAPQTLLLASSKPKIKRSTVKLASVVLEPLSLVIARVYYMEIYTSLN